MVVFVSTMVDNVLLSVFAEYDCVSCLAMLAI
jgi:hypothetical protein